MSFGFDVLVKKWSRKWINETTPQPKPMTYDLLLSIPPVFEPVFLPLLTYIIHKWYHINVEACVIVAASADNDRKKTSLKTWFDRIMSNQQIN